MNVQKMRCQQNVTTGRITQNNNYDYPLTSWLPLEVKNLPILMKRMMQQASWIMWNNSNCNFGDLETSFFSFYPCLVNCFTHSLTGQLDR